jgi:hypothetical protein
VGAVVVAELGALAVGIDEGDEPALGIVDRLGGFLLQGVGELGQEVVGAIAEAGFLPLPVGDGRQFAAAVVAVLDRLPLRIGDLRDPPLGVTVEVDAEAGAVDQAVPAIGEGVAEGVLDLLDAHPFLQVIDIAVLGGELEAGGVPGGAGLHVGQHAAAGLDQGAVVDDLQGAGGAGGGGEADIEVGDLEGGAFGVVVGGEALDPAVGQGDHDLALARRAQAELELPEDVGDFPGQPEGHVLAEGGALVVDAPAPAEVAGGLPLQAVVAADHPHRQAGGVDGEVFEGHLERPQLEVAEDRDGDPGHRGLAVDVHHPEGELVHPVGEGGGVHPAEHAVADRSVAPAELAPGVVSRPGGPDQQLVVGEVVVLGAADELEGTPELGVRRGGGEDGAGGGGVGGVAHGVDAVAADTGAAVGGGDGEAVDARGRGGQLRLAVGVQGHRQWVTLFPFSWRKTPSENKSVPFFGPKHDSHIFPSLSGFAPSNNIN